MIVVDNLKLDRRDFFFNDDEIARIEQQIEDGTLLGVNRHGNASDIELQDINCSISAVDFKVTGLEIVDVPKYSQVIDLKGYKAIKLDVDFIKPIGDLFKSMLLKSYNEDGTLIMGYRVVVDSKETKELKSNKTYVVLQTSDFMELGCVLMPYAKS